MAAASELSQLSGILHRTFGHSEFRSHQQEVCEAAAAARDVLLVMPTGAGKSLCYQLPALALGGTALVISPLIALMDDQAGKLVELGLRVARIHSGLPVGDARQACRDYLSGALDFLFIAPERMRVPGFPEMLAKRKPSLVAIDEAHCISQWGHDFRPDYRTLGQYLPALRPASIVALTATATPAVRQDIVAQLQLQNAAVFVTGFRRTNLAVEVVELSKPQRHPFTAKLLKPNSARPAIVYAPSRKAAEELAAELHRHFPTSAYHAGLLPTVREKVQREFLTGKLDVVVATIAFGMGIDKANVRTVVHTALPSSVEGFYQEIGRAGRDGLPSRSVLLHGFADRRLQEFFLEKNYPPTSDLERVARALPSEFVQVETLQRKLKLDRDTLDRAIEKLLAAGVAVMDMAGDVRSTGEESWQKGYESQVAMRRTQIDRMIAFAESNTCRMAALVQHFGDTTDRALTCGLCDICNPSGESANAAHQPNNDERRWLRQILSALESRSTSTGKLFTDLHVVKDRDDFDTLLEGLARAGLITIANDTFRTSDGKDITYKKAAITHEGHEPDDATLDTVWLRGSLSAAPSAKKKSTKSRTTSAENLPLNPQAEKLFEQLREWRRVQAAPTKTPAFMIITDAVLRAIANAAPQNLSSLLAISGMGQSKVDRYGAAVIAVCRGTATAVAADSAVKSTATKQPQQTSLQMRNTGVLRSAQDDNERQGRAKAATPTIAKSAVVTAKPVATKTQTTVELTEQQLQLESQIREWRKQEAAASGLPSFFVLSDTVLRSIALAQPGSLDELRAVRSLGAEKVERFGTAILSLCQASVHIDA
jgi:ATP-dependent DNA helicase RecQ